MRYVVLRHTIAFFLSFASVLWLVPVVIAFSRRWGWLDRPEGDLKRHRKPVPHLGGFAIFVAIMVGLLPVFPVHNNALGLILGGMILLFVGIVDDLKSLSPMHKFLGQLFVTSCLVLWGVRIKADFFSNSAAVALSGLWLMTVINAFNLIDVMDGLASVVALCATISLLCFAFLNGNFEVTLLLTSMLGGVLGFFRFNYPPAKIYLGDGGAHLLGGILGAAPLLLSWSERSLYGICVPPIIFGIPLAETLLLILIRLFYGIPPYRGSPHHFSIYLRDKGWSKLLVLCFTLVCAVSLSVIGLLLFLNKIAVLTAVALAGCGFCLFCWVVFFSPGKKEVDEEIVLVCAATRVGGKRKLGERHF